MHYLCLFRNKPTKYNINVFVYKSKHLVFEVCARYWMDHLFSDCFMPIFLGATESRNL